MLHIGFRAPAHLCTFTDRPQMEQRCHQIGGASQNWPYSLDTDCGFPECIRHGGWVQALCKWAGSGIIWAPEGLGR